MSIVQGSALLSVELLLIALAAIAIVRTGYMRLDSSIGIARDGLPPGRIAPTWHLPDLVGQVHGTPSGDQWQLLVFSDHALVAFPEVVDALNHLEGSDTELEIMVLSRDDRQHCQAVVEGLELRVNVVPVDQTLYDRFRVRVMPFAFLLNSAGVVRWAGLVKDEAQLRHAWQLLKALEPNTMTATTANSARERG